MITAKGDGSLSDFLSWADQAGHHLVVDVYKNYVDYCLYIHDAKAELSEKQRHVEE